MAKLTERAIRIFEIIKLVYMKVKTIEDGCNELGVSKATVYRYLKKLRDNGIESLNYQSHKAWNRTDFKIEEQILKTSDPLGILIKNKDTSDGFRAYFEVLWNSCEKLIAFSHRNPYEN